ncbi:hypothetical protein NDU88_002401 [Pleurodeles waltl]|uniref:Uncharacterized protein n=1 Tax=Pleurodeles waltl TaxID=8319 RepID=A0AAV7M0G4_PLEWA|nr:hypothetical protein NDU88_002401 [Pleurodeles waltl]
MNPDWWGKGPLPDPCGVQRLAAVRRGPLAPPRVRQAAAERAHQEMDIYQKGVLMSKPAVLQYCKTPKREAREIKFCQCTE